MMHKESLMKRVVITGLGIVCPVGNAVDEAWSNLRAGKSGLVRLEGENNTGSNGIGGSVKHFDAVAIFGGREARRLDRMTQFALNAAKQALEDAKVEVTEDNMYDIGCIIGSCIGGIDSLQEGIINFHERGYKAVSPLVVPRLLIDSGSARVSMEYNLRGPNYAVSSACATGNNAIGESYDLIRLGRAKMMLAGASDAALIGMAITGFSNMKALSDWEGTPETASRPFDLNRSGFVVAEGAAVLILEEREAALARGVPIYAEITGYGHTSDAYHITAPREDGHSAARAMKLALAEAGLEPKQVDHINAHGTSTTLNDKTETLALKQALGEQAYNIPITANKSMLGHMLGAAGAAEAIFSVLAMRDNYVPPTINLDTPDPECDLDYTPHVGKAHTIQHVMSNSFGFGGHNTTLIFSRAN
jgi:3-oxoacyl-[acyl-carrier-protein] synthase II